MDKKQTPDQNFIDNYLKGILSETERLKFEITLSKDKILAEDIEISQLLIEELKNREEVSRIIRAAQRSQRSKIIKLYSIAASFLLLVFIGNWQPGRMSDNEIIKQYYKPLTFNSTTLNVSPDTRSANSNLTQDEIAEIIEAEEKYRSGDFIASQQSLEKIVDLSKNAPNAFLMLAVSQMNNDDIDSATESFRILVDMSDFDNHSEAVFYFALLEIKTGHILKARKLLKQLSKTGDREYSNKAKDMLKKMRFF